MKPIKEKVSITLDWDVIEKIKNYDVRLFHTNRKMAGGARNVGLDNATGDYILFLDSDDYFTTPTVLEELNNLIKDEDMIFLNYTRDDFGQVKLIKEPKNSLEKKNATTKNTNKQLSIVTNTLFLNINNYSLQPASAQYHTTKLLICQIRTNNCSYIKNT